MEAEVRFIRRPGLQPPEGSVALSVSERLNIDLDFGSSQEH
jgi:hypothetical protein